MTAKEMFEKLGFEFEEIKATLKGTTTRHIINLKKKIGMGYMCMTIDLITEKISLAGDFNFSKNEFIALVSLIKEFGWLNEC